MTGNILKITWCRRRLPSINTEESVTKEINNPMVIVPDKTGSKKGKQCKKHVKRIHSYQIALFNTDTTEQSGTIRNRAIAIFKNASFFVKSNAIHLSINKVLNSKL